MAHAPLITGSTQLICYKLRANENTRGFGAGARASFFASSLFHTGYVSGASCIRVTLENPASERKPAAWVRQAWHCWRCVPVQAIGRSRHVQVNGCCSPIGCCIPVQFNGCCIPAQVPGWRIPAQVNGCCIPAQVNWCCIPAQVNGCCTPAQVPGCRIPAQVNGCCTPAQVNGHSVTAESMLRANERLSRSRSRSLNYFVGRLFHTNCVPGNWLDGS